MNDEHSVMVWLLIEDNGYVLVTRRKPDEPPFAGEWTLPGDFLQKGEAPSKRLADFAKEQLDVLIMGNEPFHTLHLGDGDEEYAIAVHRVGYEGRPKIRESGPFSEAGWAPRLDLKDEKAFPYLAALATEMERSE